jgi:transketolase
MAPVPAPPKANDLSAMADWVRVRTLEMHKVAPGLRIASSLSPVEILTALYFGGVLRVNPADPADSARDRFIASKGHGTLCLFPVLAALGFFPLEELTRISRDNALLSIIPEPVTPGVETTNGSLGHGLGVGAGMAVALKRLENPASVVVLCGDGEMNSGAVWEAVMFAAKHRLDNMLLIIDDNKRSMLGDQADIMGLDPLAEKLAAFRWSVEEVDGHDVEALVSVLGRLKRQADGRPKALVARTIKGHRIPALEADPLSHIRVLSPEAIDKLLESWA